MMAPLPEDVFIAGAWGGISFLNALPSGIGCAAAVRLPAIVRVERTLKKEGMALTLAWESGDTDRFLRLVIERSINMGSIEPPPSMGISLESSIPSGRGLKSSSAVSVALSRAVLRACGAEPSDEKVAELSALAAKETGVSVTGAFDDALASAKGGVVVADNMTRRGLFFGSMNEDLEVVLWIPDRAHRSAVELREMFRREGSCSSEAADHAKKGEFLKAMELNSAIVERALGYDYAELHDIGKDSGALASGVSGNGPTVAFVTPFRLSSRVAEALPREEARVMTVRFARPGEVPHG